MTASTTTNASMRPTDGEEDEEGQLPLTQEEIDALVDSGQLPEHIAEVLSSRLNPFLN